MGGGDEAYRWLPPARILKKKTDVDTVTSLPAAATECVAADGGDDRRERDRNDDSFTRKSFCRYHNNTIIVDCFGLNKS